MGPLLSTINSPEDVKRLSKEELPRLAREIRDYILEVISVNGGHLGAALGAVDVTLALHYCFTTPKDTLVWDVGHQVHAHKIITGRREAFKTFRLHGGLSGFSNKDESVHDPFTTGHGGASISTSLGIAVANRIQNNSGKVVAIIGDASLVSGMAFEALNHAGHLKDDLVVILNDNEMSISPTVGALSKSFNKFISGDFYNHLRRDIAEGLKKIPKVGTQMAEKAKKIDEGLKHLFVPGLLFEELGFRYFGPLDGHNIESLIQIFENIQKIKGPILVHLVTKKGKGYPIAEGDPAKWHASTPFCIETGIVNKPSTAKTYTQVFGETAVKLAAKNPKVIAITAAMCDGTGLVEFSKKFPDRFFDVGIAEEHGVAFAAGMAKAGVRPLVTIYSTFLQRAFDQIIHDVALQQLPVIFCMDRGGLVGEDGPTHHGVFDLSYLRKVPGMTLMAPRDGRELEAMLEFSVPHLSGPIAIRYPRGPIAEETNSPLKDVTPDVIRLVKSEVIKTGKDAALLAVGSMVYTAYEAAGLLEKEGISVTVVNARFIKPLDEALILRLAREFPLLVTLEEGALLGGFGSGILELVENTQGFEKPSIRTLGIPDRFISHGKRDVLLDGLGLSPLKIKEEVTRLLKNQPVKSYLSK
jgi:1-deoxy-D-xylulose-5-phosphate synthase